MGNRFLTMTGYHSLVKAHGILASITFLLVVPAAILVMRFYGRNPRNAVRFHIWLQITALLLTTVVFAIGLFQVGSRRSLTNPHHGIGVALFVLVWLQVIGGSVIHRIERGRRRYHVPLKAMLHHWLGRAIALLGIAQIALGLTVYGSPLYLFVLYALWVFLLLLVYFILQWRHERRRAHVAPGNSEYSSEVITEQRPQHSHSGFGKIAGAGAAGAGLAALWNRRNKPKRRHSESDLTYTSRSSSSEYYGEKPDRAENRTGWGKRILQVGAIGGGLAAAKKLFDRRKAGRDDESEVGPYRPPLGGNTSIGSDSVSRLEEGRPPRPVTPTGPAASGARPTHPLAQPPMTAGPGSGRASEDYSYYSYESSSPSRQGRHQTFRQAAAAGGTMYAVRQLFKKRGQKKEEDRTEELRQQRVEQEKIARMNSQHRYTGDGAAPPRRPRHNRATSQTASDVSSLIDGSVQRPGMSGPASGMSSATPVPGGPGAAASSALADRNRIRPVGTDPPIAHTGPTSAPMPMGGDLPPPVPTHGTELSSGSELYTTPSGGQRHRHHLAGPQAPPLATSGGAPFGPAASAAAPPDRRRRHHQPHHDAANTDSLESPPVSIHVKTQDNGRKVTLRRLTEEEAAAQRAARRTDRRTSRRRRNSSLGSSSGGELAGPGPSTGTGAHDRWKRTEQIEAAQQAAIDAGSTPRPSTTNVNANAHYGSMYPTPPPPGTHQTIDPQTGFSYAVPRPPPIPASMSISNVGPGESVTSPGTETSGPSEYANNRRRRRAERAQARLAREGRTGGGGNTVDFT